MAGIEGVRRIKSLGSWIAVGGGAIGILLWAMALAAHKAGLGELFVMLGFPVVLGALVRLVGWVIEGFVLPGAK